MRLGKIQRDIVRLLLRCKPEVGCYIGSSTKAPELAGLDLEQVERALEGLQRRRIITREGIRTLLSDWARAELG